MASRRKMRRFGEGGVTLQDVAVDDAEKPDVAITRGDAFKAARKAGKKTFKYGGKEYTTDLKKSGMTDAFTKDVAARKAMPEVTVTGRRKSADIEEAPTRGSMSADTTGAQREKDKRTAEGLTSAVMSPIAEGGIEGGLGYLAKGAKLVRASRAAGMLEDEAASMVKKATQKMTAKKAAEREGRAAREAAGDIASDRRTAKFREKLRQEANRKRIAKSPGILDRGRAPSDSDLSGVIEGYKKGGKVKKYASGGDIAPMSAMPSGKQLKENIEAQKQSEAERQARYKAVKAAAASSTNKKACGGTVKKYARGGGIEAKGKTRGKIC